MPTEEQDNRQHTKLFWDLADELQNRMGPLMGVCPVAPWERNAGGIRFGSKFWTELIFTFEEIEQMKNRRSNLLHATLKSMRKMVVELRSRADQLEKALDQLEKEGR